MPRVGAIKKCDNFKSLIDKTINQAPVVVDVEAMKAAGSPQLLMAFTLEVWSVMDHNFDAWKDSTGGGR